MANLGLKLYELRKKAKISQEEFAEIVDTSRQAVSKWERDESEPDLNKIIFSEPFKLFRSYKLIF